MLPLHIPPSDPVLCSKVMALILNSPLRRTATIHLYLWMTKPCTGDSSLNLSRMSLPRDYHSLPIQCLKHSHYFPWKGLAELLFLTPFLPGHFFSMSLAVFKGISLSLPVIEWLELFGLSIKSELLKTIHWRTNSVHECTPTTYMAGIRMYKTFYQ